MRVLKTVGLNTVATIDGVSHHFFSMYNVNKLTLIYDAVIIKSIRILYQTNFYEG